MLIKRAKSYLSNSAPRLYEYLRQSRRRQRLITEAKALVNIYGERGVKAAIEAVRSSVSFRSSQQPEEILGLLEMVKSLKPQLLCEIGCYRGGTLFLLSQVAQPDATLYSMDLSYDPIRLQAYEYFRKGGQKFSFIQGDTHKPESLARLSDMLKGQSLDFLFIDGDHSYEGVKADYDMYSPLVRSGGLIGFHDIVIDYETRYGSKTMSYTGGVPQFWQELKLLYPENSHEFIQDQGQDGFGIGVIRKK